MPTRGANERRCSAHFCIGPPKHWVAMCAGESGKVGGQGGGCRDPRKDAARVLWSGSGVRPPPGGWGAAPALSALVHGECSQCRELVGLRNRGKGGCGGRGLAPDSDLKLSGSRLFPSNPAWIPHTEPECQFTALSPAPFP